jgi:hypothetical protein
VKTCNTSVAFLLVLSTFWGGCSAPNHEPGQQVAQQSLSEHYAYGQKINYLDRKSKQLPDISVRFVGERKENSKIFPSGFVNEDFEVVKAVETKKVSWSSGTGDIGPIFFDIGGEPYVLELAISDVYDVMNNGEMVVWQRAEYDRQVSMRKR